MTKLYLDRQEAAAYLTARGQKTSKLFLQKLATVGGGPLYQLYGNRALYTPENLDAWADGRLSSPRRSTSERRGNDLDFSVTGSVTNRDAERMTSIGRDDG
jgi:hypothetical protein